MIKPNFKNEQLQRYIDQQLEIYDQNVISRMQYVGEQFIRDARSKISSETHHEAMRQITKIKGTNKIEITTDTPGFDDHTGNLRSSIGFIILKDGKRVVGGLPGDRATGVNAAKKLLRKMEVEFSSGFALVVVAGMEYAAAVESLGYDVITGSSIAAKQQLKQYFKK